MQGIKPETRTYNTIINACNRSGQAEAALQVYDRMLADGSHPSATTYTALISAYGKAGKVRMPAPAVEARGSCLPPAGSGMLAGPDQLAGEACC